MRSGAGLVKILLVRHGRPEGVSRASISGRAIGEWVRAYDERGIRRDVGPSPGLRALAAAADVIVSSDLKRARESAQRLAERREVVVDADLREAALPASLGIRLPLPPGGWIVVARLAWLLDLGDAPETVAQARARATRAADRLIALAAKRGCVFAVGHGMFNRLVAGELRRQGWRGPRSLPHGYWSVAEFEFASTKANRS